MVQLGVAFPQPRRAHQVQDATRHPDLNYPEQKPGWGTRPLDPNHGRRCGEVQCHLGLTRFLACILRVCSASCVDTALSQGMHSHQLKTRQLNTDQQLSYFPAEPSEIKRFLQPSLPFLMGKRTSQVGFPYTHTFILYVGLELIKSDKPVELIHNVSLFPIILLNRSPLAGLFKDHFLNPYHPPSLPILSASSTSAR